MMVVETFKGKSVTEHRVEVVERKGKGHPDTICDSVAEAVSVALSAYYKKNFGAVLHHNTDKGLLSAGCTKKRFGGGRVMKPMELFMGDRAAFRAEGKDIPVEKIAIRAAEKWIKEHLRFVRPHKDISFKPVLSPGSEELSDIFTRPGGVRGANDTSALVGYHPLSPTEEAVLSVEKYLNSARYKERRPETGEDIKVMGLRTGPDLDLTVAMPLIAGFIKSEKEYFSKKKELTGDIVKFLSRYKDGFRKIDVVLNALDEQGRGLGGVYLSLLGTSSEDADSGEVGRGNRVNGLISMNRPMSTEAAAGKNPVSHVGKIYNVLAHRMSEKIYRQTEGVKEVYVLLLSRIGRPVDSPLMASAQLLLEKGMKMDDISKPVEAIIEKELSLIPEFSEKLALGRFGVC